MLQKRTVLIYVCLRYSIKDYFSIKIGNLDLSEKRAILRRLRNSLMTNLVMQLAQKVAS